MPGAETIFFALLGGILPALLWLWFWLQEDRLHPEPRGMIIRTFIAGMIAVPLVLPIEQYFQAKYSFDFTFVIFLWACAEEVFKWAAAGLAAFDTKEYDEPIDAAVYMLTAALGFSAMENTMFLLTSIANTGLVESFVTGNLRFIGATLLHVLASGIVGFFMGEAFYRGWFTKKIYLVVGLLSAIVLHALFNVYIMNYVGSNIFVLFGRSVEISRLFIIFALVWVAVILLIVGFEKVKRLKDDRLM